VAELKYQSPWNAPAPVRRGAGVTAVPVHGRAVATIMVRKGKISELAAQVGEVFSIDLRDQPKRSAANNIAFLGIGPGKWLAMSDQPATGFVADMAARLDGLAAVVDQSDALAILRLSGPALPATLEKGFQIDLRSFAIGDCAVTSVHHLGATIWKIADGSFEVAVARSLTGSFQHWLSASVGVDGLIFVAD
jgi:heterotetrameric sarcosine oxidase gamma subunit